MKSGGLKETMAKAMLLEPAKVWVTMRNLRDNDMLTTGARGVNAPDLTYRDAARVLIAHIANANPGRATPRIIRNIGALPLSNPGGIPEGEPFSFAELVPGDPIDTFEDAAAALIRVFAECRDTEAFRAAGRVLRDGTFQNPRCLIEIFEEDMAAQIVMPRCEYVYSAPPPSITDWTHQDDERFRLGRQAIAFVNQEVVAVIAGGFRREGDAE